MPIPSGGQTLVPLDSQSTSIRSAIGLVGKQDERSVATMILDSSPIINHGSMFEGVLRPPASKPAS
jgi:hypothetical protein